MEKKEELLTKRHIKEIEGKKFEIPLVLGIDKQGKLMVRDLTLVKSLLISGSTGSGKTVFLSSFLYTIGAMMHPRDIGIICIETKMTRAYDSFNKSKLMYQKVIYDLELSLNTFKWLKKEMVSRYENSTKKPYIIVMIDEYSDLILNYPSVERILYNFASKGPEVGIYLILSTSRPSERIVTKKLKSVIDARIGFALSRRGDSLQLLDREGAENLNGGGDMLYKENKDSELEHLQGLYTRAEDIENLQERINHF